jgi:hypothetical protein
MTKMLTPTMIQLRNSTEWMRETYTQISQSQTIINARLFQSKGTNQETSLLILMVAQKINNNPEKGGDTNSINSTALQYHSVSNLMTALKSNTILQELHHKISTTYYSHPQKHILCPHLIPHFTKTAYNPTFDNLDFLSWQD